MRVGKAAISKRRSRGTDQHSPAAHKWFISANLGDALTADFPTEQLMADPRFPLIPYAPYVGFWRRSFAVLIDFFLMAIVLAITAVVISQVMEPAADQKSDFFQISGV